MRFALGLLLFVLSAAGAGAAEMPPGASSCTGCHATSSKVDTPAPRIAGLSATAIQEAMSAWRQGTRPATVMERIAKGFTEDEIKAIALWYEAQEAK
jgi:cytochrome c553